MGIKFPTIHIAESVTNRILNVWDELEAADEAVTTPMPPTAPSTPVGVEMQGAQLDAALSQPAPPMESPLGIEAPTAGTVLEGQPPIAGVP